MTLAQAPCTALIGRDSLARITPAETASGPPITTARRLVEVSVSPNTRRAYLAALHAATLGRLDAVIAGLLFMGGMRRSEVAARGGRMWPTPATESSSPSAAARRTRMARRMMSAT